MWVLQFPVRTRRQAGASLLLRRGAFVGELPRLTWPPEIGPMSAVEDWESDGWCGPPLCHRGDRASEEGCGVGGVRWPLGSNPALLLTVLPTPVSVHIHICVYVSVHTCGCTFFQSKVRRSCLPCFFFFFTSFYSTFYTVSRSFFHITGSSLQLLLTTSDICI